MTDVSALLVSKDAEIQNLMRVKNRLGIENAKLCEELKAARAEKQKLTKDLADPGAKVRAFVEAAEQYCEYLKWQHPDTLGDEDRLLLDAYALRGKEGEGDAKKAG